MQDCEVELGQLGSNAARRCCEIGLRDASWGRDKKKGTQCGSCAMGAQNIVTGSAMQLFGTDCNHKWEPFRPCVRWRKRRSPGFPPSRLPAQVSLCAWVSALRRAVGLCLSNGAGGILCVGTLSLFGLPSLIPRSPSRSYSSSLVSLDDSTATRVSLISVQFVMIPRSSALAQRGVRTFQPVRRVTLHARRWNSSPSQPSPTVCGQLISCCTLL